MRLPGVVKDVRDKNIWMMKALGVGVNKAKSNKLSTVLEITHRRNVGRKNSEANNEIPAKGIHTHLPPQEKRNRNVRPEQASPNPWWWWWWWWWWWELTTSLATETDISTPLKPNPAWPISIHIAYFQAINRLLPHFPSIHILVLCEQCASRPL
jgi:hypothetical protein